MSSRLARTVWFVPSLLVLALVLGSVLAFAVPDVVRIPRLNPEAAGPLPQAVFSHRGHSQYQCYACHPAIFPQARVGFTHEAMDQARYCGQCHNGNGAPAVKKYVCEACHAP